MKRLTDAQYRFLFGGAKTGSKPARNPFKRRAEEMPENQVEALCVSWLRVLGWRVTRQQSGLFSRPGAGHIRIRIGEKGLPDWRCERPIIPAGKRPQDALTMECFHLECKAPGERPDPVQVGWMIGSNALGTPATWCDSLPMLQDWYRVRYGRRAGDPPGVGLVDRDRAPETEHSGKAD